MINEDIRADIDYLKIQIKELEFEGEQLKRDFTFVENNIVKRFIEERICELEKKKEHKEFAIWKLAKD